MDWVGVANYAIFFMAMAGIYAVLALGLNVQWGYTGLFNLGVHGFFAVGAYTSALLTVGPSPLHVGGLGLPFLAGMAGGAAAAGLLAYLIGLVTLRLREEYLAIATIGIAEIVRLVLNNERSLAGGVWGIAGIPRPLYQLISGYFNWNWFYAAVVFVILFLSYTAVERGIRSPWGRVLKAIREDEAVALAVGKDVFRFKLQALVLGSVVMGIAGSLYTHMVGFINPEAFEPMTGTFLVWVMLVVGGSGNSRGAILGAFVIWGIWSFTEFAVDLLPETLAARAGAIRIMLIGTLLLATLLVRPRGILGEERQVSRLLRAGARGSEARA